MVGCERSTRDVVERMLAEAAVTKDDVVYDLGSGDVYDLGSCDGRIVIEAAKRYQCRAVGLELDRQLVELARQRAIEAKVDHLVTFKEADIFTSDFSEATVVATYLYPEMLSRLYPKLRQLANGARIVSHQFEIPNVPPEKTIPVVSRETGVTHTIYLWTPELLGAVALLGIQIYLLATRSQSLGKYLMKTQIVDVNTGLRADFVHAFLLRLLVNGLISGVPCVGTIYALVDILFIFREDRRCIHDLLASTCVVDIS